jgi:hypothetical protein
MEQVYYNVGFAVVWILIGTVGSLAALLVAAYVRGLYRAVRLTAWMARNSTKKNEITAWMLFKNTLNFWNKMAWFGKNDTMSHQNGSVFHV